MTGFPIDLITKATLLLAAAAFADLALRPRASAAARHLVWSLAIGALLALPIASAALPAWHVRIPIPRASVALPAGAGAAPSNPVAAPGVTPRAVPVPSSETTAPGTAIILAAATPFVLYVAGVLFLLTRLAIEPFALRRLTRASRPVSDPAWRELLDDSARLLRVGRPVRLLQSARDVMPMTFGTLTPTIVLPASADEWTADRRRAVLLHELAHVARFDCLVQRLTAYACALYWPHPGVWWAARRLRVERELACDDRVLTAGAPARDYASHLLELAHSLGASPAPATALGMARARQLEGRLLAILDAARNRATLHRRGLTAAIAVAIALVVPMAALRATLVADDPSPSATPPGSSSFFAPAAQELTGTWEVHPSGDPARVQLMVRYGRSSHGRTLPLAELEALAGTKISAAGPVHFPIRREAGTFTVDGVCRNGACAGTYVFEPSATFAADLAKRGIGRPTPQDQFALAAADIGTAFLDALAAAGYTKPDLATLVRAATHGVDLGYLKDMTSLGYKLGTLEPLIRLRDHGVDPQYIRGMADGGVKGLTADELVRTRDHGVDPEYIRGLASLGHTGLSVDALVETRDHGVDPTYITGMQSFGYKLTLPELRRTRDHGVDPAYVRGLSSLGYGGLTVDALVNARDHGVDPEYVRDMAALGYKGTSLDDLIRMRDHGVDPSYVRRLQQRGVRNLSVDEIVRRRDHGDDR